MSGGSFDYAYYNVAQFADDLNSTLGKTDQEGFSPTTISKLYQIEKNIRLSAALMKEVEWLYSGDIGEESFMENVQEIESEFRAKTLEHDYNLIIAP